MTKRSFTLLLSLLLVTLSNAQSQWTKVHLSDTLYSQQLRVDNLVECNGYLVAKAAGKGFFRSTDYGESWKQIYSANISDDLYSNGKTLFTNDPYNLGFLRSADNGTTWKNIDNSFQFKHITSFASNATETFIGTDAGIFCSTDEGISWEPRNSGLPNDYYDVHITPITSLLIDGSKLYAGTRYHGIFVSSNNGNSWKSLSNGLPSGSYDFPSTDEIVTMISYGNTIFASLDGDSRSVYKLSKGDNLWTKADNNLVNDYNSVDLVTSFLTKDSSLFAVAIGGIYSTNDNGNNWKLVNDGTPFNLSGGSYMEGVLFNSNFYLLGSFGIYMSTDNGITWLPKNEGLLDTLNRVPTHIDSYNSILAVRSNDDRLYISSGLGNSWQDQGTTYTGYNDTLINKFTDEDDKFFKIFGEFFLRKNVDESWKKIFITYPFIGYPNGTQDLILLDTTLIAASRGGIFYTGYNNETIFYGETTKDLIPSQTKLSSCISLTANDEAIFVGTTDGVYKSTDSGKNWELKGLKSKKVYKLISMDTKLIAHTDQGLFRSLDGGNNWNYFDFGLGIVSRLTLCGDNLFVLAGPSYSTSKIWKKSFYDVVTNVKEEKTTPLNFSLSQNYPNPFNPTTTISYSIPESQNIELKVYDLLGNEVASLVNEYKTAGSYKVNFNANNLSSGIYFYKIKAGDFIQTKKLILLK